MTKKLPFSCKASFVLSIALVVAVTGNSQSPSAKRPRPRPTETPEPSRSSSPESRTTPALLVQSLSSPPAGSETKPPPADNGVRPDWQLALATLLTGALGFLGALLVEKRSWKRRKLEQVREAQLQKITGISRQLRIFSVILANVEKECVAPASISQPSSGGSGLWQAQARAAILRAIPTMESALAEVEMMSVELMTLRVKNDVMTDLDAYLKKARAIVGQVRGAAEIGDPGKVCETVTSVSRDSELEAYFRRFIDHALDGLNE